MVQMGIKKTGFDTFVDGIQKNECETRGTNMDWALEFYTKQDEWSGCYTGDVTDDHRKRAAWVHAQISGESKRILELGSGGGQVAVAMAAMGHDITAIDLVVSACEHARDLAAEHGSDSVKVINGDFYTHEFPDPFDVVCYFDGFGIGTDADQRRLFGRIRNWLSQDGFALIEIGTPWYAASVSGRGWTVGQGKRLYSFDAEGCRWNDRWWPIGKPEEALEQSTRCYSPADLRLLAEGTGLSIDEITPGGTVDWEAGKWLPNVPLERAMAYIATLRPANNE